jgi:hypothetical protein
MRFAHKMQGSGMGLRAKRNLLTGPSILEEMNDESKARSMKTPRIPTLLLLLGLLNAAAGLRAQDVDHVYLKSGSVIRGKILEIDPADHVKIEDLCGNIWYHDLTEVVKITSEEYRASSGKQVQGFSQGFVNMTSLGFLVGASSNMQVAPFSLVMVNGWHSPFGMFSGVGVGIEFLNTNYIPLFADLRYDLGSGDVVPFLLARGGYSLPSSRGYSEYDTEYTYSGGPTAAAGVGLRIRTRNHFAWNIELMYRYLQTSYTEAYGWNNQEYKYTDIYNRVEIRLGFYID